METVVGQSQGQTLQVVKRLPNWRGPLNAVIDSHRHHAFAYGSHDCALLAADAVKAVIGIDPAATFRGRYSDRAGADAVLREAGFDDQVVALAASLFPEIHPSMARVGDLAAVSSRLLGFGDSLALGVVTGPNIAVMAMAGLGFVSLAEALRAFKVGL